jgi:hypothetical protein
VSRAGALRKGRATREETHVGIIKHSAGEVLPDPEDRDADITIQGLTVDPSIPSNPVRASRPSSSAGDPEQGQGGDRDGR